MDYSGTLRRGWSITWQNKWLWLLAVLPLPSPWGVGRLVTTILSLSVASPAIPTPSPDTSPVIPLLTLQQGPTAYAGPAMLVSYLIPLVSMVALVVSLVAHGGLIRAVAQRARDEATSFSGSLNAGLRRMAPLLGMTILLYALPVTVFVVSILVGINPILMITGGGSAYQTLWLDITGNGMLLARFLGVALVVASLFLSLIYLFAARGIILHRLSAMKGIGHGWRVVRNNAGKIVLFTLPFLLLYLLLRLAMSALQMTFIGSGVLEYQLLIGWISGSFSPVFWRYLLIFGLIFVLSTLLSGVLTAWQSATFTLAYLQWTGKDVLADPIAPLVE